jgi:hypothetical protein
VCLSPGASRSQCEAEYPFASSAEEDTASRLYLNVIRLHLLLITKLDLNQFRPQDFNRLVVSLMVVQVFVFQRAGGHEVVLGF